MKCPKCEQGEVLMNISLSGIFKKKKVITFYCPVCSFINKHEFELSVDDYELELNKKKMLLNVKTFSNNKK